MQSCLQTVTDPGTKNIWNWNKHTTLRTTLRARKSCLHAATKGEETKRSGIVKGIKHAKLFTNCHRSGDQKYLELE